MTIIIDSVGYNQNKQNLMLSGIDFMSPESFYPIIPFSNLKMPAMLKMLQRRKEAIFKIETLFLPTVIPDTSATEKNTVQKSDA